MGAKGQQGETLKLMVNLIIGANWVRTNSVNIAQAITDRRKECNGENEEGGEKTKKGIKGVTGEKGKI